MLLVTRPTTEEVYEFIFLIKVSNEQSQVGRPAPVWGKTNNGENIARLCASCLPGFVPFSLCAFSLPAFVPCAFNPHRHPNPGATCSKIADNTCTL